MNTDKKKILELLDKSICGGIPTRPVGNTEEEEPGAGSRVSLIRLLDARDFTGKTIVPFCTSGGTGIGENAKWMQEIIRAPAAINYVQNCSRAHLRQGKCTCYIQD